MLVEGIQERIQTQSQGEAGGHRAVSTSSRRRKGPAFLPSEHDDLPLNVAFMVSAESCGKASMRADCFPRDFRLSQVTWRQSRH